MSAEEHHPKPVKNRRFTMTSMPHLHAEAEAVTSRYATGSDDPEKAAELNDLYSKLDEMENVVSDVTGFTIGDGSDEPPPLKPGEYDPNKKSTFRSSSVFLFCFLLLANFLRRKSLVRHTYQISSMFYVPYNSSVY